MNHTVDEFFDTGKYLLIGAFLASVFQMFFDRNVKDVTGNKAVVARYGITCCIADASVWGMIVTGQNVEKIPEETWVKITGLLDETTYKGTVFPLVKVNKIEKINKPNKPYVYDALPQ